jgi:hypothetical protein
MARRAGKQQTATATAITNSDTVTTYVPAD